MNERPLECRRQDFTLPADLHYLNCAYMSPLPRAVEAAGVEGIARKRAPNGIVPADFFDDADRVRAEFGRLINAPDAADVALVPAVSYGISLVARNTVAEAGGTIVVAGEQFPSNVYPWRRLARRWGLEIRTVAPPDSARRGEAWNAAILDAIDARTAAVALPHVHWTDGTLFDLAAVGLACRKHDAAFVVDGSQSIGALPFDVAEIGADAVVCAGYKWLMGPYGMCVAWLGARYADAEPLEDTWIGRAGSEDFQGLVDYRDEYQPGAARFDVGERSSFILVPMLLRALQLVNEWGPPRIQHYCSDLAAGAIDEAAALGFRAEDPDLRASHLFGMRAPGGIDLRELQRSLADHGVSVSLRGNAMRVSPHLYNDSADFDALLAVLREAVAGAGAA